VWRALARGDGSVAKVADEAPEDPESIFDLDS